MSILASDLKFYNSGGSSNADPNLSLGGAKSSVQLSTDVLNNILDSVTGDEHVAGNINYRCIFVKNASAETAYNVKLWIDSNTTATEDTINIGLDTNGVGDTSTSIVNESTAPSPTVTFVTAVDQSNALSLGNLTAGQSYPVWVKRIVSAGTTAQANNSATLKIYVDTL